MSIKDYINEQLEESINHKDYLINFFSNGFFPLHGETEHCPGINKRSTCDDRSYINKRIYKIFNYLKYHVFVEEYIKNAKR